MNQVKRFRADHRHVVETEFDDAQFVSVADYDALQQRLTVAEQLLSEALCHAQRIEPISASLFNRIDSAIEISSKQAVQPAHICEGCGSNGWTGNCDECIPY